MQSTIGSYITQISHCLYFKDTAIKLSGRPYILPNVTDCKYLDITIPVKNCDIDMKRQIRKLYANANILLKNLVNDEK